MTYRPTWISKIDLFGGLGAVHLAGGSVQPAEANSKENGHYDVAVVWQPATCENGQAIVENWVTSVDVKTFLDNDGIVFKVEETVTQTGKIYLEDQPWKVIYYENEHWKNMFRPNGLTFGPGIVMKVTIPGYGIIFQDIGGIVFPWSEERQVIPQLHLRASVWHEQIRR